MTNVNPEEKLFEYLFGGNKINPKIKPLVYDEKGKRAPVEVSVHFFLHNFLGVVRLD